MAAPMRGWSAPCEALGRRRRWERPAFLALVALMAVPGTWLRTTLPHERVDQLNISAVPTTGEDLPRGLSVEGLWELDSRDPRFGGYSALLIRQRHRAVAFSDHGETLAFTLPGKGPPRPRLAAVPLHPRQGRAKPDIESATADPVTGSIWLGYEQVHTIRRFSRGDRMGRTAWQPQMRDWPSNAGAEALVRLADGRFLALGERNDKGLLFAGDPVDLAPAEEFAVAWPEGFRPVDAAQLPDGRVLILTRKVEIAWPPFASLLMVGDPRAIGEGATWRPEVLARLDGPLPRENYEGLAVVPDGDSLAIWLISDDNFGTFQRTLLVKLRWRE